MNKTKVGFALCGSFCTFDKAIEQMKALVREGCEVYPIFSENAGSMDTRFGYAKDFIGQAEAICDHTAVTSIKEAELFGPKLPLDVMVIAPCTGNTLGKLANSITDTSVTMASKAHLRNGKPLVIAVSTNDALSGSAANIGSLMCRKNIYFVPLRQDNPTVKPASAVADFEQIVPAVKEALDGKQIQPLLLGASK